MSKTVNGNTPDPRFWLSRKFWLTVLGGVIFTTLAVTGTVVFTSKEVMIFVLTLVLGNVGAHTATDVVSMITSVLRETRGGK